MGKQGQEEPPPLLQIRGRQRVIPVENHPGRAKPGATTEPPTEVEKAPRKQGPQRLPVGRSRPITQDKRNQVDPGGRPGPRILERMCAQMREQRARIDDHPVGTLAEALPQQGHLLLAPLVERREKPRQPVGLAQLQQPTEQVGRQPLAKGREPGPGALPFGLGHLAHQTDHVVLMLVGDLRPRLAGQLTGVPRGPQARGEKLRHSRRTNGRQRPKGRPGGLRIPVVAHLDQRRHERGEAEAPHDACPFSPRGRILVAQRAFRADSASPRRVRSRPCRR